MGSRAARRHAPDYRATLSSILFRQRGKCSRTGAHRETRLSPGPADLQLDYPGSDCRQYSSPGLDQVARAAATVDAANDRSVTDHLLVVTRFLAIRPATLFQRKFLGEKAFKSPLAPR